jgi:primary-amine oxidase
MSLQIEVQAPQPTAVPTKQEISHPLAPVTAGEITHASKLIRERWPENTRLQYKVVTLEEPPKTQILPYLEAEHTGGPLPSIDRKIFVNYYLQNTVSKDDTKWRMFG